MDNKLKNNLVWLECLGLLISIIVICYYTYSTWSDKISMEVKEYVEVKYKKDFKIVDKKFYFFHNRFIVYLKPVEGNSGNFKAFKNLNRGKYYDEYPFSVWEHELLKDSKPIVNTFFPSSSIEIKTDYLSDYEQDAIIFGISNYNFFGKDIPHYSNYSLNLFININDNLKESYLEKIHEFSKILSKKSEKIQVYFNFRKYGSNKIEHLNCGNTLLLSHSKNIKDFCEYSVVDYKK